MLQLIFTPHAIYKYFRNIVQGYDAGGIDSLYIEPTVGSNAVAKLKYFKIGSGGPGDNVDLTRQWFDSNIKDKGTVLGNGDLNTPGIIFSSGGGYLADNTKKELTANNFYNYGNSNASKVTGVMGVTPDLAGNPGHNEYWNIPGVLFQVTCPLNQSEGNIASPINELGIFDENDVLMLYGVFNGQAKTNATSWKVNGVAMLKTLDFQLTTPVVA